MRFERITSLMKITVRQLTYEGMWYELPALMAQRHVLTQHLLELIVSKRGTSKRS